MAEELERATIPLYAQVKRILYSMVETSELQPGDRVPSENELIALYHISSTTARRVLNDMVQEGVLYRVQGKGTFVARPAVDERVRHRVSIVMPHCEADELDNFYFGSVIMGLHEGLAGLATQVALSWKDPDRRLSYLEVYRQDSSLGGMAIVAPREDALDELKELREMSAPFVVVGATFAGHGIPSVDTDNVQGAKDAVRHLVGLGHRRIALVSATLDEMNSIDRSRGYAQALEEAGLTLDPDLVFEQPQAARNLDFAVDAVDTILDMVDSPTAVFAASHPLAMGVMLALKTRGIRIPDDISLIGFDDLSSSLYVEPPLSTVSQPIFEMAKRAGRLLAEIMKGNRPAGGSCEVLLSTKLVVRESCGPRNKM